jgi:hypothetical protein
VDGFTERRGGNNQSWEGGGGGDEALFFSHETERGTIIGEVVFGYFDLFFPRFSYLGRRWLHKWNK